MHLTVSELKPVSPAAFHFPRIPTLVEISYTLPKITGWKLEIKLYNLVFLCKLLYFLTQMCISHAINQFL